jgi:hypothetical protein
MQTLSRPVLSLKKDEAPRAEAEQQAPEVPKTLFYFVWSPQANRPRKRHATLELAQSEAERLREEVPEKMFLVYEARIVGEVSP